MSGLFARPAKGPPNPARPADSTPGGTGASKSNPLDDSELQTTPLQTGTAAKRLQEQEDVREMFRYPTEPRGLLGRLRRYGWPTLRYLTQTEVHTYAFSVAANSILSLCPLIGCF